MTAALVPFLLVPCLLLGRRIAGSPASRGSIELEVRHTTLRVTIKLTGIGSRLRLVFSPIAAAHIDNLVVRSAASIRHPQLSPLESTSVSVDGDVDEILYVYRASPSSPGTSSYGGISVRGVAVIPLATLLPAVRPQPSYWETRILTEGTTVVGPPEIAVDQPTTPCGYMPRGGFLAFGDLVSAPAAVGARASERVLVPGDLAADCGSLRQLYRAVRDAASETCKHRNKSGPLVLLPGTELAGLWAHMPWLGPIPIGRLDRPDARRELGRHLAWSQVLSRLGPRQLGTIDHRGIALGVIAREAELFGLTGLDSAQRNHVARRWHREHHDYINAFADSSVMTVLGGPTAVNADPFGAMRGWRLHVLPELVGELLQQSGVSAGAEVVGAMFEELVSTGTCQHALPANGAVRFATHDLALDPRRAAVMPLAESPDLCPDLTLAVTESTQGYLENCGCTATMLGGAARRNHVVRQLKADGRTIAVDLGDFLGQPGDPLPAREAQRQQLLADLYRDGGYDLLIPEPIDHVYTVRRRFGRLVDLGAPPAETVRVHAFEKAGRRVAIVGVPGIRWQKYADVYLGDLGRSKLASCGMPDATADVGRVAKQWRRADFDAVILAGQMSPSTCWDLIDAFPDIDLVLSSNPCMLDPRQSHPCSAEPVRVMPSHVYHGVPVCFVDTGPYRVHRIAIRVRNDGPVDIAQNRIPLSLDVSERTESRAMIADFYRRSVRPSDWHHGALFPGQGRRGNGYVGSAKCLTCHASDYPDWAASGHANSLASLLRRKRDHVPDCVRCHVTGLGETNGYAPDSPNAEDLADVGCEMCHGGGARHSETRAPSDIQRRVPISHCMRCHDPGRGFGGMERDPAGYFARIRHW